MIAIPIDLFVDHLTGFSLFCFRGTLSLEILIIRQLSLFWFALFIIQDGRYSWSCCNVSPGSGQDSPAEQLSRFHTDTAAFEWDQGSIASVSE